MVTKMPPFYHTCKWFILILRHNKKKKKKNTWRKIPIDDHKTSKMVKLAKT